jgi:hypothetical protein
LIVVNCFLDFDSLPEIQTRTKIPITCLSLYNILKEEKTNMMLFLKGECGFLENQEKIDH